MVKIDFNKAVGQHKDSEKYQFYKFGEDYYTGKNTYIMNRKKKVLLDGFGVCENIFQANYRLPSGFFKKIVDQKVQYLLGNGIKFEIQEQDIDQYFETSLDDCMIDIATTASKKSVAWLYAYKSNNQLLFTEVAPEQITPVYDESGNLVYVIREYDEQGKAVRLVYDSQTVQRYERKRNKFELVEQYGHYVKTLSVNGKLVSEEPNGFGVVPFIPLYNNRERLSDLVPIKEYIDSYDVVMSDFANNIDDMQDAYFTLKGYTGDIGNLNEFMRQLKQIKAVPISADGDITANQLQIPTEARSVMLDRTEKEIYKTAMALNVSDLKGGSITNVVIKAMLIDLDLKCDQFEWQIRKFMTKLIDFINFVEGTSYTDQIYLDRSFIMNRSEQIDDILKTRGIYSDQTIMEKLPFDVDIDQELERIEAEKGEISLVNDLEE